MNPLEKPDIFHFEGFNPNPSFSKAKDGPIYRVSFEVKQEDWQNFVDANTKGMIINFAAEVVESHNEIPREEVKGILSDDPERRPKGGPISKNAGMLCNDPDANKFADRQGYPDFKRMIYAKCEISSRAELDHDRAAANAYEDLKHRFYRWEAD